MRRVLPVASAAALLGLAFGSMAVAQDLKGEPFELVRSLQSLQDQVVQGNSRAHAAQRVLLGRIAEQFEALSAEMWQDPKNVRAAVVFVLSGGNVRILHKLLRSVPGKASDEALVKGALAYGEGRHEEAAELLAAVDARTLDPGLAGHVAYVQGELAAKKDPAKALGYLDDARLLSPGTIVEEAALRRQIGLLAAAGDAERHEALATQYMRRFPSSVYAAGFRQQFALAMAGHVKAGEPDRLARLEAMLGRVDKEEQRNIYLTIAKEAVAKGKVPVARFAAAHAVRLSDDQSLERARATVYEAAATIVTDEFQRGLDALNSADAGKLPQADAALLDAALAVAAQVRRMPDTPSTEPPAAAGERTNATLERARAAVSRVDDILSKADTQ
jgi:chemotaxis protein MotC